VRDRGLGAAPHRAEPASRFVLDDSSTLQGQGGGLALDGVGSVVEINEGEVVAFDVHGDQRWSTPVAGAERGWPWLGRGVALVPTLSSWDIHTGDPRGGGCTALDRSTGRHRWSYDEDGRDGVAVSGLGHRAYCVFRDGTAVAIDLDTGKLVWRSELWHGAPDGTVTDRTVLALDAKTQSLVYSIAYGNEWLVVVRGLAHGEDRGGIQLHTDLAPTAPIVIHPGRVVFTHGAGIVEEVDLRSSKVLAQVNVPAVEGFDPASVPVSANGVVVVVASDGSVSAVDLARERLLWTTHLDTAFVDVKPVITNGTVVFADDVRTTYALRLSDGSKVSVPSVDGFVVSTAADPAGGVVVATRGPFSDGKLQRWRPAD
jgi:outer membrane protein assembly factor BamB